MLPLLLAATLDLAPHARDGHALASAVVREGRVARTETHGAPAGAVFRMASLSKVVTAYVVVQLAEEGRVDLQADVARYLPDVPLRRHRSAPVTLHHLLTHTSGIEDAFFGNTVRVSDGVPTLEEHFRRRPPTFGRAPGKAVVYSNEGLALAGLIVERVTRLPFAECVRRRVFAPLGMHASTFAQPPPFSVVASGAEGEALVQAPAGAMVSTASDMSRLLLHLLGDSAAVREMRATPYGLFRDDSRGGLFHTGRSGHESVLYLLPAQRTGVFLVHTGGLDRTLRRRYVESVIGPANVIASTVNIRSGVYRPLLLPVTRVERVGEVATDAQVAVDGTRIIVRMPPFARGQTLTFVNGVAAEGRRIAGGPDTFVLTGPLLDPVTFVRVPVWASGRVRLALFMLCGLIVLSAVFRTRGLSRIGFALVVAFLVAAPVAFAVSYYPRDAASRPFHVESSVRAATTMLTLAACAALLTPLAAWRTRVARVHAALASAAALALVLSLHHWNLLGWQF